MIPSARSIARKWRLPKRTGAVISPVALQPRPMWRLLGGWWRPLNPCFPMWRRPSSVYGWAAVRAFGYEPIKRWWLPHDRHWWWLVAWWQQPTLQATLAAGWHDPATAPPSVEVAYPYVASPPPVRLPRFRRWLVGRRPFRAAGQVACTALVACGIWVGRLGWHR